MELQIAKGTRDFLPEEKILRDDVSGKIKNVFERYGYSPLETPELERFETLASKYAGGAEILREIFKLKDQGERDLALRYDLTVPLARVIGMNPQIKMPFKRYQISTVFRDGPLKAGRYRCFVQCDVDVVGVKSVKADAEMISIAKNIFDDLGIDVVIKVNDRKILNDVMSYAGISSEMCDSIILTIDKLDKVGSSGVKKELAEKGLSENTIKNLFDIVDVDGNNSIKLAKLKKILGGTEGLKEMLELLRYSDFKNVIFTPSLARGLAYYTGPIFEVYAEKSGIKSSLAAGGRWDKMIGNFLERGEYPATGISFGLDTIIDVLNEKKISTKKTVTQAYVIPINEFEEALKLANALRESGANVDIDMNDFGVGKNLEYANKYGIPHVIFVGKEELKKKKFKLRNMKTGREEYLDLKKLVKKLA